MIEWILTVILLTHEEGDPKQKMSMSGWTTENDCKQAEKLERVIADLQKRKKEITCQKIELR